MGFDVLQYFLNESLREQNDEDDDSENFGATDPNQMAQNPQDPSQMGNQGAPQSNQKKAGEQGSPAQQPKGKMSPFSDLRGKAIKDIKFSQPNSNAGKLEIYFADMDVPLVISWSGGKVTAFKPPNGEVFPLN